MILPTERLIDDHLDHLVYFVRWWENKRTRLALHVITGNTGYP